MVITRPSLLKNEKPLGTFRVLVVLQRHQRTHREVILLDAESMGETKATFHKHHFSYILEGITEAKVNRGNWLLSPRDRLGFIKEAKVVGPWSPSKRSKKRVVLHVRFDENGIIRLNELWRIFVRRPITRSQLAIWEKRMVDTAKQYFQDILPNVIDSVLYEDNIAIDGDQVDVIVGVQEKILRRAIQIAEHQQMLQLTNNHLIQATQDILKLEKKS